MPGEKAENCKNAFLAVLCASKSMEALMYKYA